MVLSNKINLVPQGAPSEPSNQSSFNKQHHNNTNELHSSPALSFLAAAKGKLAPSAPRVVKRTSSVTLNVNCRPSAAATSAPSYISILHDPLSPTTPLTYKTGSSDCSVTYTIPPAYRHLDMEFLSKLRQEYPYGIGYAIQHKEEGNSLSVELGLASQDYCNDAINKPIIIKDISFPATRTFPTSLTRFNFSGVPMESPMETKDTLLKIFSRYGKVIDIVLHLDDVSSAWFRGNGHVLVETTESTSDQPSPSYKVDYNAKTAILVTWAKMPKHCRYCKAMGHTRDFCPERPTETRTCFTCGVRGHLSVNCKRAPPTEPEASKRSRHIEPTSPITTRVMATPRNPNISKYSTQNTSAVAMPNSNQPSSIVLNRAISPGEDSSDDAHFLDDIDFSQLTPDLIGEQPEQTTTSLAPQEEVVDLMTPQVEDEDIDLVESQDEDQNLNINEPPTPNTEAQFIQAVQFTKPVKAHRHTKQQTPLPTRVSSRTTKGKAPIRLGDEDFQ